MECQTEFNEVVNSHLSFQTFNENTYRQDIKNDIFVSLHKPEVVKVLGEREQQELRKSPLTGLAEAKIKASNRWIPIQPQFDWVSHPTVKEYFTSIGLKPKLKNKLNRLTKIKLKPEENTLDKFIADSLEATTASVDTISGNESFYAADKINISLEQAFKLAAQTGLSNDTAVKTILAHELAHANTVAVLDAAQMGNEQAIEKVKSLYKIYEQYKSIEKNYPYIDEMGKALDLSLEEVSARILTDKSFQNHMKTNLGESTLKSLLNRILEFLGLKKSIGTLINESLEEYQNLLTDNLSGELSNIIQSGSDVTTQGKVYKFSKGEEEYYDTIDKNSEIMKDINSKSKDVVTVYKEDQSEEDFYEINGAKVDRLSIWKHNIIDKKRWDLDKVFNIVAKRTWDENRLDYSKKLPIGDAGENLSFEGFKEYIKSNTLKSQAKGRLIHALIEKRIAEKANIPVDENLSKVIEVETRKFKELEKNSYKTNMKWVESTVDAYLEAAGLNVTDREAADFHTVSLEVGIHSKILGFATRIDTLAQRQIDGKFLMLDHKTGHNVLSKKFKSLINEFGLEFGAITDNARDLAKLELMLRAIALKADYPEIEFYDLRIGNVQNAERAKMREFLDSVEVKSYLSLLKRTFNNRDMLEKKGLIKEGDKTIYEQLVEISPNIFDPTSYIDNGTPSLKKAVRNHGTNNLLTDKFEELKERIGNSLIEDTAENRQAISQIVEDMYRIKSDNSEQYNQDMRDLGLISMVFGNYSEIRLPMLQDWVKEYNEQKKKAVYESGEFETKLQLLDDKLVKEHSKKFNIRSKSRFTRHVRYRTYDGSNKGLFDFAYKTYTDADGRELERLYTKERDPVYFKQLTPTQQEYLNFVNEAIQEATDYYNTPAFTTEQFGKEVPTSHLDMFNKARNTTNELTKRKMNTGFFFKHNMTSAERWAMGYRKDGLAGAIKELGKEFKESITWFEEDSYDAEELPPYIIPMRGLGNTYIDTNMLYTGNLTLSTSHGIKAYIRKKHMDDIAVKGYSIINWLESKKYEKGHDFGRYKFLFENKYYQSVLGVTRRLHWSTEREILSYTDRYGNTKAFEFSWDKILKKLSRFGTATIMPFRLFQPLGTGTQAWSILAKDIASNEIYKSLYKTFGAEYDEYTLKSFARAHKELTRLGKDQAINTQRGNKAFLLMRNTGFLPKSYDWYIDRNTIESMSLRGFDSSTAYAPQKFTEDTVSYLTLLSQMMSIKHTHNGETKSLYDWYEVQDNKLVWTGGIRGYEYSSNKDVEPKKIEGVTSREIIHMEKIYEELQGGYSTDSLSPIEAYVPGQAVMALKRWLPRIILNAVHSKRTDYLKGKYIPKLDNKGNIMYMENEKGEKIPLLEWKAQVSEGKFRTLAKAIVSILSFGKFGDFKWNKLEEYQKRNLIEAMITLTMFGGSLLAWATMYDDDEKETTEAKWIRRYLIDNMSQQYNLLTIGDNFVDSTKVIALEKGYSFVYNVAAFSAAVVMQDYTQKGDIRGFRTLMRDIPYLSPIYQSYRMIQDSQAVEDWEKGYTQ